MSSIFDVDLPFFPYNVINELVTALQELAPHSDPRLQDGLRIHRRSLNNGDSGDSIGIYPVLYDPIEESVEMRGRVAAEPTRVTYPIEIESLVVDADEWAGIRAHSLLAAMIRNEIHRSELLEARLPQLVTEVRGVVERYSGHRVSGQTFISSRPESMFSFMSVTTVIVTTEIQ